MSTRSTAGIAVLGREARASTGKQFAWLSLLTIWHQAVLIVFMQGMFAVCGPPAVLLLWAADFRSPATLTVWPLDSCLKSSSLMVSRSAGHPPALAVLTCARQQLRNATAQDLQDPFTAYLAQDQRQTLHMGRPAQGC